MKHFILATAGHVDHGKSALIKALTGTDPDRLPEEKSRGITIDLGFAELNLTGTKGEQIHVGMVDVPGHEDFVRNMIAGVGSIDLALLVVAADDGWMPQTEEHLQILSYLGVERAVVVLTKSDLGGIGTVTRQIRDRLRDSPFASAQIVATSVRNGDCIESLKSGSSVYLHHGTSRTAAKIALLKNRLLEAGKDEIAQLKLGSPIFAFAGDRFVIRDPSEQYTLAGGMVLDPDDGEFRDETIRKLLMARATAPNDVHLWVRSEVGLRRFVSTQGLLDKSRFSNGEIADAVLNL